MSKGERKFILILFIIILCASIWLIIQINTEREYDPQIYEEIYSEYEKLFENNSNSEEKINNTSNMNNTSENIINTNTSNNSTETSSSKNKILNKTIRRK